MSAESVTAAESPVEGSQSLSDGLSVPVEGDHAGEAPSEPQKANKEARFRQERNEAREALSAAQERITSLLRSDIERVAGEVLAQGSDLFLGSDGELSQFLNEDGTVDYDRVREAANEVIAERPGLKKLQPAVDPSQGLGGAPKIQAPSWGSLFH